MTDTPQQTSPPDAPEIPGYRVVRKLGQGGMAIVWLAVQESLDRQVAIKVMLPLASVDEQQARRFEHEARTIARLEHPHIVHIVEVGHTHDGRLYYVMAFLPRGDLSHRDLSNTQTSVLKVLRALLDALAYAHARGVVHRDVKAENVLFDGDDRPMLADFGIALSSRAESRLTSAGMTLGSGGYMAPEQSRGERVDGRADLYSVGVLAYEMLIGELPYRATDPLALALKHAHNPIPRLPRHLDHWQPFIDRAMAKSPNRRFRNAETMRAALDRIEKRMNGAAATFGEHWYRFRNHSFWHRRTTRWLLGAATVVSLAWLLVSVTRQAPDEAAADAGMIVTDVAVGTDASGDQGAAPVPADSFPTSVSLPAEPEQIEAWLTTLKTDPLDAEATAGLARQIDWLEEQVELDFAAGDDAAVRERKALAEQWSKDHPALAPAYARFQRLLTGLLVSEAQIALNKGDRKTAERSETLLQDLGYTLEPLIRDDDGTVAGPAGNPAEARRSPGAARPPAPRLSGFVTRKQYGAFVEATGRADTRCRNQLSPLRIFDKRNWRDPGFEQTESDPVVCVSAGDALAYLDWLSKRDGRQYRLPQPVERPQNNQGLAEWTLACIASGNPDNPCPRRVAAGPLMQQQPLDGDRGFDNVGFRWVAD